MQTIKFFLSYIFILATISIQASSKYPAQTNVRKPTISGIPIKNQPNSRNFGEIAHSIIPEKALSFFDHNFSPDHLVCYSFSHLITHEYRVKIQENYKILDTKEKGKYLTHLEETGFLIKDKEFIDTPIQQTISQHGPIGQTTSLSKKTCSKTVNQTLAYQNNKNQHNTNISPCKSKSKGPRLNQNAAIRNLLKEIYPTFDENMTTDELLKELLK